MKAPLSRNGLCLLCLFLAAFTADAVPPARPLDELVLTDGTRIPCHILWATASDVHFNDASQKQQWLPLAKFTDESLTKVIEKMKPDLHHLQHWSSSYDITNPKLRQHNAALRAQLDAKTSTQDNVVAPPAADTPLVQDHGRQAEPPLAPRALLLNLVSQQGAVWKQINERRQEESRLVRENEALLTQFREKGVTELKRRLLHEASPLTSEDWQKLARSFPLDDCLPSILDEIEGSRFSPSITASLLALEGSAVTLDRWTRGYVSCIIITAYLYELQADMPPAAAEQDKLIGLILRRADTTLNTYVVDVLPPIPICAMYSMGGPSYTEYQNEKRNRSAHRIGTTASAVDTQLHYLRYMLYGLYHDEKYGDRARSHPLTGKARELMDRDLKTADSSALWDAHLKQRSQRRLAQTKDSWPASN